MGLTYGGYNKIKWSDIVVFVFLVAVAVFVLHCHHNNPPEKQKMIDTSMRVHYKYNHDK